MDVNMSRMDVKMSRMGGMKQKSSRVLGVRFDPDQVGPASLLNGETRGTPP